MIKKLKQMMFCMIVEVMLIACVAFANLNPTPLRYFIFYNLMYGVVFSFLLPLYFLRKENRLLSSVGMKKLGVRQFTVFIVFVAFSIGGQLIPRMVADGQIPWHLLPMGMVPLMMTTFFEEFLFRGFVQSRVEQQFGWLPAVFVSGFMFSLYHLGYPGFRAWKDILLLFAVGLGFAIAYKLSDNNLIVSYFVNLPNALVTYMLKYEQFPIMKFHSTIAAMITLVLIVLTLSKAWRSYERE